jgi:TolB protein
VGFTPGFAPPEQYGGGRTGPFTDQYALAATLYFLLSGEKPAESAQRMIEQEILKPLKAINPALPDNICLAIERALSLRPDQRFESVGSFLKALNDPNFTGSLLDESDATIRKVKPGETNRDKNHPPELESYFSQPETKGKRFSLGWVIGVVLFLALASVFTIWFFRNNPFKDNPSTPTATSEILSPGPTQTSFAKTLTETQPVVIITRTQQPTSTQELEPTNEPTTTEETTPTPDPYINVMEVGGGGVITYVSDQTGDGIPQIFLMRFGLDVNLSPVILENDQLTFDPQPKSQPAWSPDGRKLLYVAPQTGSDVNGDPYGLDIWMLDFSVPAPVAQDISFKAGDDKDPAWSPDGSMIAYTSYFREDGNGQLMLMNADGSKARMLSTRGFNEYAPTWSPDGNYLMYVLYLQDLKILYLRDSYNNYDKDVQFDLFTNSGRQGMVAEPDWSPDGKMIAYTQEYYGQRRLNTVVFNTHGSEVAYLAFTGMDYQPDWSPDSQWMVFVSERDGNPELYLMDISGEHQIRLLESYGIQKDPAWNLQVSPQ